MEPSYDFPYYETRSFTASLCGHDVRVVSKPGLPHWGEVTPTVQLLAEAVRLPQDGQVLQLGCGHGALGVAFARQNGGEGLCLMDPNWIALRVAKKTLEMNGFPGVTVEPLDYPLPAQAYHTVVIDLPKGRKLARRWLVEAWGALQLDGELYLAGANLAGIRSVIQDAGDVFGNATVLAYRKGCRVARMLKRSIEADSSDPTSSGLTLNPPVAWAVQPGLERGSWVEFITSACGEYLLLHSLPGVFSFDRVDEGTGLLLQQLSRDQVHEKLVLDFGCGYGLIGMAAARLGAAWVELIDVDLSAVASARDNLSLNGISNAQVRPSDVLEAVRSEHFDLILSNPPFHSGKEVEYSIARTFIAHAWHLLNRGGRLELVANRFIRYDQLMMEIFGNVRRVAETGKFYVLESAR